MVKYSLAFLFFSITIGFFLGNSFQPSIAQSPPLEINISKETIKGFIIAGIILLLFIWYLACIIMIFFLDQKSESRKIKIAEENIKVLTGFFVGAITGYLG